MLLFLSLDDIAATTKPSMHERVSTNTDKTSGISSENSTESRLDFANIKYTITVGIITISSYISPIKYTPHSRTNSIIDGGIGIDSSKSLSFARYIDEYVLNTLPNTPNATAIRLISAKYSQPSPTVTSGSHSGNAMVKNIPPRKQNNTTYSSTYKIIPFFERLLPDFLST